MILSRLAMTVGGFRLPERFFQSATNCSHLTIFLIKSINSPAREVLSGSLKIKSTAFDSFNLRPHIA
ncbi:MAG: hypothetical protein IKH45_00875 [Neisseriaceae bacterium]|nr:hypothetical protein [Neisseriaceae bacterium]